MAVRGLCLSGALIFFSAGCGQVTKDPPLALLHPDGRRVAYVVRDRGPDALEDVRIAEPERGAPRVVAKGFSFARVTWSPRFPVLALYESDLRLVRFDLGGEPHLEIAESTNGSLDYMHWSSDGRYLAYRAGSKLPEVHVFDTQAPGSAPVVLTSTQHDVFFAWSPTAPVLAVSIDDGLYFAHAEAGFALEPVQLPASLYKPSLDRERAWSPDGRWIVFNALAGPAFAEDGFFIASPIAGSPVREVQIVPVTPGCFGRAAWSLDGHLLQLPDCATKTGAGSVVAVTEDAISAPTAWKGGGTNWLSGSRLLSVSADVTHTHASLYDFSAFPQVTTSDVFDLDYHCVPAAVAANEPRVLLECAHVNTDTVELRIWEPGVAVPELVAVPAYSRGFSAENPWSPDGRQLLIGASDTFAGPINLYEVRYPVPREIQPFDLVRVGAKVEPWPRGQGASLRCSCSA